MASETSSKRADLLLNGLSVKIDNSAPTNDHGNGQSGLQSTSTETSVRQLNLKSEADRVKTFDMWPVPFMDKTVMAAAGFIYLNRSDTVQCVYCNIQIGCWEEGDDPFKDHRRWSPACPFLRGRFVGNVPQNSIPGITPPPDPVFDVCGPYGMELRPNAVTENSSPPFHTLQAKHGIIEARGPVYVAKGSLDARMRTFETWPKSIRQRPEALSAAGFFYTGRGDQTLCFHCGAGLKDWQENDDPWVEHAKWFPKCMFLILNKGNDFIEMVSRIKDTTVPAEAVRDISACGDRSVSTGEVEPIVKSVEKSSAVCEKPLAEETKTSEPTDDHLLCKICYQEERGVLFLPCGHLVACVKCAPVLSTCAVCRKPVTATVRAFIP